MRNLQTNNFEKEEKLVLLPQVLTPPLNCAEHQWRLLGQLSKFAVTLVMIGFMLFSKLA